MKHGVQVIITDDDKLLLMKRENTRYFDSSYGLPGGNVEEGEDRIVAAIRETQEEVDLHIRDLQFLFSIQDHEWEHHFFHAKYWEGTPKNLEPEKCSDVEWWPIKAIPQNRTPLVQQAIDYLLSDAGHVLSSI
jgi:ADP-ribose pyrophosphatase YjhB (NUDIX family)